MLRNVLQNINLKINVFIPTRHTIFRLENEHRDSDILEYGYNYRRVLQRRGLNSFPYTW